MNTNNEILKFLDGTIGAEDEAELLHRLSVSPERRELLRSYMQQAEMFERDRTSIHVPYSAEQKLWAKLGMIMPAAHSAQHAASPAAPLVATAVQSKRYFGWLSFVGAAFVSLLIGFGSGFFTGKETAESHVVHSTPLVAAQTLTNSSGIAATQTVAPQEKVIVKEVVRYVQIPSTENTSHSDASAVADVAHSDAIVTDDISQHSPSDLNEGEGSQSFAAISNVRGVDAFAQTPLRIGEGMSGARTISGFRAGEDMPKTFLDRWEFMFTEGFGKEYPDNSLTRVSFPVVTNSSVSAMYQLFDNENLWVGATVGTTNMSKKNLKLVNNIGPMDYEVITEVSHNQAAWYGGFVQYRLPITNAFAFTATGGAAGSSMGFIMSGELGSRIELTNKVGLSIGVKVADLTYSLAEQQNSIIDELHRLNKPSAGMPNTSGSQHSQNLELTTGLYFRF